MRMIIPKKTVLKYNSSRQTGYGTAPPLSGAPFLLVIVPIKRVDLLEGAP